MRYLSISEIFELHDLIISSSGGSRGIRDINALKSAVNLPRQTFDQKDLYPDIVTKAAALCFSLENWGRTKVERCQIRHELKNKAVFRS
jgi:death-on-curing protein